MWRWVVSDIVRHRGDTRRIQRTVRTSDGATVPITDWTFKLTISAESAPTDATEQIGQIVGVITDAPGGVVEFTPLAADVANAGRFFYDIEAVDSNSGITTLDKGAFVLLQDITK